MTTSRSENIFSFEDTKTAFAALNDAQLSKAWAIFWAMNQNWFVKLGTFVIKTAINWGLPVSFLVKNTVFSQFCGGETINSCNNTIRSLARSNIKTILDYSVEGEDTEEDFEQTKNEIIKTILKAANEIDISFAVFKVSGLGNVALLEKAQNRPSELNVDEKKSFERIAKRVGEICGIAHQNNVKIFIDAEESWIQSVIDQMAYEQMRLLNRERCIVFNTYQMYRINSIVHLKSIEKEADNEGYKIGVKLVRGAYIEKERQRAAELGLPDLMQPTKETTDMDFDKALTMILDRLDRFEICLGTHNQPSCLKAIEILKENSIEPNDSRVWFAQLLGMSDIISYNLSAAGYNVAKYVPFGPIVSVMPYLLRRAAENTSMAGQTSRELTLINIERQRRKRV